MKVSLLVLIAFVGLSLAKMNFIAMGDWGTHHEGKDTSQVDVAAAMAKVAESKGIDFVVALGDNFYEKGVSSVNDPLFKIDFEQVYHQSSLMKPWHVVLGNHDHDGSINAQIEYSSKSNRWRMPSRYFSQSFFDQSTSTNITIVFLDSNPFIEKDDPAQWAWLKGVLANDRSDWTFITAHHPVVACGDESGNATAWKQFISGMNSLMSVYGVDFYFSGHKHNLQHLAKDNVNYFVSGSGGRLSSLHHHSCKVKEYLVNGFEKNGFALVEIQDKTSVVVSFYDSSATKLYSVPFSKNDRNIKNKVQIQN